MADLSMLANGLRAEKGSLIFMSSSEGLPRPVLERLALCYSNAAEREFNTCIELIPEDSVQLEITLEVLGGPAALEQEAREIGTTLNCWDYTQWFVTELLKTLKRGEVNRTGN